MGGMNEQRGRRKDENTARRLCWCKQTILCNKRKSVFVWVCVGPSVIATQSFVSYTFVSRLYSTLHIQMMRLDATLRRINISQGLEQQEQHPNNLHYSARDAGGAAVCKWVQASPLLCSFHPGVSPASKTSSTQTEMLWKRRKEEKNICIYI